MAVPSTNISLLGLRREFETNNYSDSRTYSNISLFALSNGDIKKHNRANPLTKIRSNSRNSGGHKLFDFAGYDHDFDFADSAIRWNSGDAQFRPTNSVRTSTGISSGPIAKAYLKGSSNYVALTLLPNSNGRNSTLIGSKSSATDMTRNNSVTHTKVANKSFKVGNGPDTYDYPHPDGKGYKGSLGSSTALKDGTYYAVLQADINSSSKIENPVVWADSSFTSDSNYIALDTLLGKNYDIRSLDTNSTYAFVFNFGHWIARKGPRNPTSSHPTGNRLRFSEFQVYYGRID
jgi:hypothetical protein